MSYSVDRPWNPARITTLPASRDSLIRAGRISTIRALPCWRIGDDPGLGARVEAARQPRALTAIASRDIAMRSPAVRACRARAARDGRDVRGLVEEVVRGLAHGRDHDDHVLASLRARTIRPATPGCGRCRRPRSRRISARRWACEEGSSGVRGSANGGFVEPSPGKGVPWPTSSPNRASTSRTRRASTSARSTASTRALGCSTSSRMSAWIATPACRCAPSPRSSRTRSSPVSGSSSRPSTPSGSRTP